MSIQLLVGDCRETLSSVADGSIQAAITSPPYWSLRDYGTKPLVWGGDAEHVHEWGAHERGPWAQHLPSANSQTIRNNAYHDSMGKIAGVFCACGAWRGSLGLEPSPDLYIEHLVECFREVRRVLRDDGVVWLNLGDSYAGSGKGPTGWNGIGDQVRRQGFNGHSQAFELARHEGMREHGLLSNRAVSGQRNRAGPAQAPYKPKDLLMIPFRVAMALQADGWYLRSVIPWLKRAAMPESVKDRPATAVEYVFLLSKSRHYYWDPDAVRLGVSGTAHTRGDGVNPKAQKVPAGWGGDGRHDGIPQGRYRPKQNASMSAAIAGAVTSRNRRNSDWFFESWQGLLLDEDDDPLALVVNPAPYSGAHYASFPPKLVEPMIRASTRPNDRVLDPFAGAGTVGLVADRLGRHAVLCELKQDYVDQSTQRLTGDAPLFTTVQVS